MKRIFHFLFLLFLTACGGGSGGTYMPANTGQHRTDLFFGYYVTDGIVPEVADHVNLIQEAGIIPLDQRIAEMKATGKPTMLGVEGEMYKALNSDGSVIGVKTDAEIDASLTVTFDALRAAGVLNQVVSLYPVDEPEVHGLDDRQVTNANTVAKRVMARYPELANTKIAVTYTSKQVLPGFATYDLIGMDDYGPGSDILVSTAWQEIMTKLTPKQRVFVVPGGASPWKQNPEAFIRYAQNTPQCVGILVFIWRDWDGHTGVVNNGMADTYRAAGRSIVGAN
jgi:hypothetical protein